MSDQKPAIGSIGWVDLTVDNADEVKSFYESVVGWKSTPLSMGTYDDFVMSSSETDTPVSGICFAKGNNANIPPQWLIYVNVSDILASVDACKAGGGKLVTPIRTMEGQGKYCVIQDPAGACMALFEPTP